MKLVHRNLLTKLTAVLVPFGEASLCFALAAAVLVTSPALSTVENRCEARKSGASVPCAEPASEPASKMTGMRPEAGSTPEAGSRASLAPGSRFADAGGVEFKERFGKYGILKELGRGGMGVVYLAKDTESGRLVTLKVDTYPYPEEEAQRRNPFEQEARMQARLRHPNIPEVYETGIIKGMGFISMQYVSGETLRDIISKCRPTVEEALVVTEQIARILDYAHGEGVIHLDINPKNILIDDAGQSYIFDFGIAEILPEEGFVEERRLIGTPQYMSPEQIRGVADRRSDIYSLGIVLYKMLTGRAPFGGKDVTYHKLHSNPPLPTQFDPQIPKGVEAMVLKAISKDPEERYQSAAEFSDAIGREITALGLEGKDAGEVTAGLAARSSSIARRKKDSYDEFFPWDEARRRAVEGLLVTDKIKKDVCAFLEDAQPFTLLPDEAYFSERRLTLLLGSLLAQYKNWEEAGDMRLVGTYHDIGRILLADSLYVHLKVRGKLRDKIFFCLRNLLFQSVASWCDFTKQVPEKSEVARVVSEALGGVEEVSYRDVIRTVGGQEDALIGDMIRNVFIELRMTIDEELLGPALPPAAVVEIQNASSAMRSSN